MKRVRILCEGPTEEQFVNRILIPYFQPQEIFVTPILLVTKRYVSGGKERGGVSTYSKISEQLHALGHFCVQADFFDLFRGKGRWNRYDGHLMNSGFQRKNTIIYKILIYY